MMRNCVPISIVSIPWLLVMINFTNRINLNSTLEWRCSTIALTIFIHQYIPIEKNHRSNESGKTLGAWRISLSNLWTSNFLSLSSFFSYHKHNNKDDSYPYWVICSLFSFLIRAKSRSCETLNRNSNHFYYFEVNV